MTRRPFRPDEVDMLDNELESIIADLERYLADSADDPSSGFSDRVMTRIAGEPAPQRGVLAAISLAFTSERGRIALLAATVAVAILAVVAAGQLSRLMPNQFGSSPSPSVSVPSVVPTVPVTVQPTPSPSAEPTDDEKSASPDASDDDRETSRPSESPEETDNSGPGSSDDGGGNSGPGSSDDGSGNSGPGGGGDDSGNSGPGGGSASPGADD